MTFKALGVIALGLLSISLDAGAQGAPAWIKRFHHTSDSKDTPVALTTDRSGNFIVAGNTYQKAGTTDIVLIKYSGTGIPLWTNYYDGPGHNSDLAKAVTTDESDNVYLTGSARSSVTSDDLLTAAYSKDGVLLWTHIYTMGTNAYSNQHQDRGRAIVARRNIVYVTGETQLSGNGLVPDYVTLAYTTAGVPVWTNYFSGGPSRSDKPYAMALGPQGEVLVTGSSEDSQYAYGSYSTVAYSSAGSAIWTNQYRPGSETYNGAFDMVADQSGNIYVTGSSGYYFRRDFVTIAYSSDGTQLWLNQYNGSGDRNDIATALIVGPGGNIYLTGTTVETNGGNNYTTIAYSSTGTPLWTSQFGVGLTNSDSTAGIVTDGTNIFVTGTSVGFAGASEINTIAYSEAGIPLWTNSFAVAGGQATAFKISYAQGRLVVLGSSSIAGGDDIVTVAYTTSGVSLWTNRYNGLMGHHAKAGGVAADNNGNIYVTGKSLNLTTIAYAPNGTELWTNRFYATGESSIAADNSNGVYIGFGKFQTLKYSGQGTLLWSNPPAPTTSATIYEIAVADNRVYTVGDAYTLRTVAADTGAPLWLKGDSQSKAVAPGPNGSVYVTGFSGVNCSSVGYGSNGGDFILNQRFGYNYLAEGGAVGVDVAVGANSNIYVAARARQAYNTEDFVTLAYSSAGLPLWTNFYSASDTSLEDIVGLVVDHESNVYVTGSSRNAAGSDDYVTIAYSPAGVALWTNRYDGGGSEQPKGIATDNVNIYVTGTASPAGFSTADIVTVAYSKMGVPLWTNRYDGPGHTTDALSYTAKPITVVPDGVVVVGFSQDSRGLDEYVVIKYSTQNQAPLSAGFGAATLRNQPLEMSGLNLLAAASDPEGGPVSLFSVPTNSANGGTIAQNAGVITYTPPTGFVGADQFTYVVSDNQGATANVLARIAVLPPGTVIHAFATPAITPGATSLNFAGAPGDTWSIYRAEQLDGPWIKIGAMTIPATGLSEFQDLNSPGGAAFYRAAKP